jgi:predicted amidophosphoribosyltransferase
VYEAVRETGATDARGQYVDAQKWVCDCCGHEFLFVRQSCDEWRHDKNIHDYCPRCGFQPDWTMTANNYASSSGVLPEWYERYKRETEESLKKRNGAWSYDKQAIDAYAEKMRRDKIEAMKESCAREVAGLVRAKAV